jgi:membrane-bound metal-dependent hydrolase YbcI (DUF457 family)
MFIGHFALGFAAKRVAPAVSLGTLFLAGQLADLVWPSLLLLGVERVEIEPGNTAVTPLDFVSYPYSHSLLALWLWAAVFAGAYWLTKRQWPAGPLTIAFLVVSHWVLDAITHRPDMPLTFGGSERVGLGLWSSVPGTVVVETLLFVIGVAIYARATKPRDRSGSIGLWLLVGFLYAVSIANLFSPPPPNTTAVAWVTQAMWLLVAWGYWVDRHRLPRTMQQATRIR